MVKERREFPKRSERNRIPRWRRDQAEGRSRCKRIMGKRKKRRRSAAGEAVKVPMWARVLGKRPFPREEQGLRGPRPSAEVEEKAGESPPGAVQVHPFPGWDEEGFKMAVGMGKRAKGRGKPPPIGAGEGVQPPGTMDLVSRAMDRVTD